MRRIQVSATELLSQTGPEFHSRLQPEDRIIFQGLRVRQKRRLRIRLLQLERATAADVSARDTLSRIAAAAKYWTGYL